MMALAKQKSSLSCCASGSPGVGVFFRQAALKETS